MFKVDSWYKCMPKPNDTWGMFHIMYVYHIAEDNFDDLDQHIYNQNENIRHDFSSAHQMIDFDNVEISEKLAKKFLKLWGHSTK